MTGILDNIKILHSKRVMFVVVTVLCFLLYGNSLTNGYAVDDEIVIHNNELVKQGLTGIPEIITSHYDAGISGSYEYRPVPLITFAVEYQFFGKNPFISHLISVLLYALLVFQLYLLLYELGLRNKPILLLLSILFFIVHPIHTEVVNNIKSRDELLFLIFALMATRYFVKYVDTRKKLFLLLGLLLIILSSLSKITAIVFVPIIPLTIYYFREVKGWSLFLIFSLAFMGPLLYLILSKWLIAGTDSGLIRVFQYYENPLIEHSFLEKIPAAAYILLYLGGLLIFPYPLSFYYGYDAVKIASWSNWEVYPAIVLYLAFFVFAIMLFKRKHIVSFLIFFYLFAVFPFSNLMIPAPGIVAERFLFAASIPFCVMIGYLIIKLSKQKICVSVALLLILTGAIWTLHRNTHWKNVLTLMERDIEFLGRSYKANSLYAAKLYNNFFEKKDERLVDKSIKHYKQALSIYQNSYTAHNNVGVIYLNHKREFEQSIHHFQEAIAIDSMTIDARLNLATAYKRMGKHQEVIETMDDLLVIEDSSVEIFINYIEYLNEHGFHHKALDISQQMKVKYPKKPESHLKLGDSYGYMNNIEEAIHSYENYYKLTEDKEMAGHLSRLYYQIDDPKKGEKYEKLMRSKE